VPASSLTRVEEERCRPLQQNDTREEEGDEHAECSHEVVRTSSFRPVPWRLGTLWKYHAIGNVRGLGFMQAIEFVTDRTSKWPDPVARSES